MSISPGFANTISEYRKRRQNEMSKKTTKAMTGIGIGMVIGGVGAAIGTGMMQSASPIKKKASKALRSMEDMLGGLQTMLR